jgi:uncharacterized membrane protein YidH (DUF202 family)
VTVLALLQTLSGIQLLIQSFIIASMVTSPEVQESLSSFADEELAKSLPAILTLLGIVFLAIAILSFHLARGYMHGHEWARRRGRKVAVLAIVFAVVGLILMPGRADPGAPIWTILFNVFILVYLNRRRVRAFFN